MDFYKKEDLLLQIWYHGLWDKISNYSFILKLIFWIFNSIFLMVCFFVFLMIDIRTLWYLIIFFVFFISNIVLFLLFILYISFSKNKISFYKNALVVENMFSPSWGIVFSYQNIKTHIYNTTFEIQFQGIISYNYKIKNLQTSEIEQIKNVKTKLSFN